MIDPKNFKAPFIRPEKAWAEADRIRKEHWPSGTLPVEVEEIIWKVGLKLEPIPSLGEAGDIDALLSGDLKSIMVDENEYMDDRQLNRMRYSMAHELGHFILHRDVYSSIRFTSVVEWIDFMQNIPEDQYSFIEQHAYEFAGRLLVPPDRLKIEFDKAVKRAEASGFAEWESSGDAAVEYIAGSFCRVFGVSDQVIKRRIIREKLWPLVK